MKYHVIENEEGDWELWLEEDDEDDLSLVAVFFEEDLAIDVAYDLNQKEGNDSDEDLVDSFEDDVYAVDDRRVAPPESWEDEGGH